MWGEKRGITKKNSTNKSPHKEEKVIGGVVDLDLLSLFSLNLGKNHWRDLEKPKLFRSQTMEEREKVGSLLLEKKEAIYSLPQNLTVTATGGRNFRG